MRSARAFLFAAAVFTAVSGTSSICPAFAQGNSDPPGWSESGEASFYGHLWQGRRTASGERFDNKALTAAHPWLPFGTRVRVLADTGREVVVTVTDRMGSARRVIDLSREAARLLGIIRAGTAEVTLLID